MTIKEETLHSNIETVNSKQLATLKKHFPQCFDKSGNFIQQKMLEVVNANEVEFSKESYTLNWLGKSYARLLTNFPPKTLINEDVAHNQLEQNKDSKNLIRNINNRLRKNYKILSELNISGKTKVTRTKLYDKGFDFNFFTSIYKTKTGNTYFYIYDEGYLPLENEYYALVKRE